MSEIAVVKRFRKRRQRFTNWWLPAMLVDPFKKCPHLFQRQIYGDEIIAANFNRARCLDCGRLLFYLDPWRNR